MSNKNLTEVENVEKVLTRLREAYNLDTNTKLAKKLGYSSTGTLSNWKTRGAIDLNRIKTYCENISIDYLTSGEGMKFLDEYERGFSALEERINDQGMPHNALDLLIEALEDDVNNIQDDLEVVMNRIRKLRGLNLADDKR